MEFKMRLAGEISPTSTLEFLKTNSWMNLHDKYQPVLAGVVFLPLMKTRTLLVKLRSWWKLNIPNIPSSDELL